MKTNFLKKFSKNYEPLRKFLRIISCGCYHRTQFDQWNIMPRSYDELLRQLRFIIPENRLKIARHGRYSCTVFSGGDTYHGSFNFLQSVYLVKTILPASTLHVLCILQLLNGAQKPMGIEDMVEALYTPLMDFDPGEQDRDSDLVQLFRRRCQELESQGILRCGREGSKKVYTVAPARFADLSAEETEQLLAAVSWYRNVALLSAPGYFLETSLRERCPEADVPEGIFQFKNNHLVRILDDEVILNVLEAMRRGGAMELRREEKKPIRLLADRIETDYIYNRQYICVSDAQHQTAAIRADRVESVARPKKSGEGVKALRRKKARPPQELRLRVHFADEAERGRRLAVLKDILPQGEVMEGGGEVIFTAAVKDPLHVYPWLWPLQPWAEIVAPDALRERMREAAKEVLEHYGIAL